MAIKPIKVFFCGWPGTGTSSAAKKLKLCLKERGIPIEIVSSGGAFRDLAIAKYPDLPKDQALAQLEVDAETDKDVDRIVDSKTLSELRSPRHIIFDSRIAPHFGEKVRAEVGDSYHFCYVRLVCSPWTSAKRVASRVNEVDLKDVTLRMSFRAYRDNLHRVIVAGGRYRKLYNIHGLESQVNRWDQVFNTGKHSTDQIVKKIVDDIAQRGWLA